MSCKTSSDFGLYADEWRNNEGKRWLKCFFGCGLLIFLLVSLLSTIRAYSDNSSATEPPVFENLHPEKLSRSLSDSEGEKEAPRPFGIDFKAPVPAAFVLSSTTEKITTIDYPQLARYRHTYQPRNIQDILRFTAPLISPKSYDRMNMAYQNQFSSSNYNQYPLGQNQYQLPNQRYGFNQLSSNHDPFYAFKPQDPSDINLMATASVRFAPPPWKNMQSKPKIYPNHQADMLDHTHMRDAMRNRNKPLIVTLNIFPMTDQDKMMMSNPQYQGQFNVFGRMLANSDMAARSSNMIVRFNLFPEAFSSINRQDKME